jgi:hypothetical protein
MKIYKIREILNKADLCIKHKRPFNIIRFGDGGIKFIHSILYNDFKQLNTIVKKEGLSWPNIIDIFDLWGYYARRADYIDTPEVYYDGTFWPRLKRPGKQINTETIERLVMWKELYHSSEFDNDNYCNPEANFLMILDIPGQTNLFDLMKGRKVGLITARPEVKDVLSKYDVDIIPIVGQYENQYEKSFKKVTKIINQKSRYYDFWLIAAGELGRLYTGMIKQEGGRAIDIGFVIEYWLGTPLHPRLIAFMRRSSKNPLETRLTNEGKKYIDSI